MINIIGEIGINHNASLELCKRLIDLAVISGFDYVKFQKRTPEKCVPEHKRDEPKSTPWGEMTYLEYKHYIEFAENEYKFINNYCKKVGIKWFASVWDKESADFMAEYTTICKIPSALITDIGLLKYCKKLFSFRIISTGMSTEKEIKKAIKIFDPHVIMHTNSTYPSPVNELNLDYIQWLKDKHPYREIGYSGHEFGLTTTFAAVALGATWIERHITLDHNLWGSDQKASIDPVGCIKLVRGIRDIEKALSGYGPREVLESELSKRNDLRK